jgi:hypothetical protein
MAWCLVEHLLLPYLVALDPLVQTYPQNTTKFEVHLLPHYANVMMVARRLLLRAVLFTYFNDSEM